MKNRSNDSQSKKVPFHRYLSSDYQKMLCHLIQNKLLSIDAELEKDQSKCLEIRGLNDTEKFTSQVLSRLLNQ